MDVVTSLTPSVESTVWIGLKTLPPSAPAKCSPTAFLLAWLSTREPESPGLEYRVQNTWSRKPTDLPRSS